MQELAETIEERKKGRAFWGLLLGPGVILLFYVLSWGPFVMMEQKGVMRGRPTFLEDFYFPLYWAYNETGLRTPLGMYLHLWCPRAFDKNGNLQ